MQNFYTQIASALQAMRNCERSGNHGEWLKRYRARIEALVKEHAPSGSGFDNGTKFDFDKSTPSKLVFNTAFHHMSEHGFYDGWTQHRVIVTRDFCGLEVRVTGRNRNDIKDLISQNFDVMDTAVETPEV